MRPANLYTKIFLDGANPEETKKALELLGFLDGQTTNPSNVVKNATIAAKLAEGKKFSETELLTEYKIIIKEISDQIPTGSISIEVYADAGTGKDEMVASGLDMAGWIPNACIKLPITKAGLLAATELVKHRVPLNMTLCFSEEQAAAVHLATLGAEPGSVFISPFVGRLEDNGFEGFDLIKNILALYAKNDGHVQVLAASIRTIEQFLYAISLKADIVTAPFSVIEEWAKRGKPVPDQDSVAYSVSGKHIARVYEAVPHNLESISLTHDLTDQGLAKFATDWKKALAAVK